MKKLGKVICPNSLNWRPGIGGKGAQSGVSGGSREGLTVLGAPPIGRSEEHTCPHHLFIVYIHAHLPLLRTEEVTLQIYSLCIGLRASAPGAGLSVLAPPSARPRPRARVSSAGSRHIGSGRRRSQERRREGRGVRLLPGLPAPGPARIPAATAGPAWALWGPGRCRTRCHCPRGLTESPGRGSGCSTSVSRLAPGVWRTQSSRWFCLGLTQRMAPVVT